MANKLKKFLKSFTLIELIIVIAIIAVLGASAFIVLSQWMSKSRDSRKIADLGTIDTAINISFTSNDKLPTPDNMTNIMFGGAKVWELGFFGDGVVSQIGGALTQTPSDPTTKTWYRYAQWDNKKYQLGTIVENEQFSDYFSRVYANEYFTRLQGSYNQSIIVTKIGTDDVIIPAPSLIVDAITGTSQTLDEEHFWTNKGTYNLGEEQTNKLKVETLFSGNISELQDPNKYEEFKTKFTNTYSGTVFLKDFTTDLNEDKIEEIVSAELKKVSSQNVSVQYLSCDGYNHGTKMNYYKQETVGYGESCDSIKSQFECKNGVWEGEANKAEYTKTSCNAQQPAQCDGNDHGTVKDFFSADSVAFGQSCETTKKSFTCENGIWKDGTNNADTTTYQYTSCVVGNPVDCNASNIVKKSVTNLDITFDITATLHGLSFEKAKTITENNGSYEYTLVGDCSNGTYQDVTLSDPVNKGCNTGYDQLGNSCVPKNCDASTQMVNGHTYTVGSINHGLNSTVTTNPIGISNGTITYTQTFSCSLGETIASGSETTNTPNCNVPYEVSGSNCVLNNYFQGGGTNGNPWMKSGGVLLTSCKAYNLGAYTLNNGTLRGAGTCGDGTKACLSSGIYKIDPDGGSTSNSFEVYCNMTTDGGGWTLVHKTTDNTNDLTGSLDTTEGIPDWESNSEYRLTIDYWQGLSTEKAMAMNIRIDGVSWNDIETGYITSISTSLVTFSQTDTYKIFNVGTQGYSQNTCTSGSYYWNGACCSRCINYDSSSNYGAPINSPMVNISSVSYDGSAIEGAGGSSDSNRHRLSKMGIFLK